MTACCIRDSFGNVLKVGDQYWIWPMILGQNEIYPKRLSSWSIAAYS